MSMSQFGKRSGVFAVLIFLAFLAADCSDSKLEVKGNSKLDPATPVTFNAVNNSTEKIDGMKPGSVKKEAGKVVKSEGTVQNGLENGNLSPPVVVGDDQTSEKNDDVSSKGVVKDNVSEKKGENANGSEPKSKAKDDVLVSTKNVEEDGLESKSNVKEEGLESKSNAKEDGSESKSNAKEDGSESKSNAEEDGSESKSNAEEDGSESKSNAKEEVVEQSSESSTSVEKGKPRAGECDSSNRCVDEKNDLVACLQVPGNDSPDLLLLIQNGGKQPLTVGIAAPEFVQLEKTKVQLQAKEDKKVKVSIGYDGIDSLIVLTTKGGRCNLDFRDLVRDPKGETQYTYKLNYLTNFTRTPYMLFGSVTIIFILASCWMCVGFGRKYFLKNGYQELEMELPVSGQPKTDPSDGAWNDDWDDNWVDEEAPKTPTLPVTPSVSSRGLASRRLTKEAWKD